MRQAGYRRDQTIPRKQGVMGKTQDEIRFGGSHLQGIEKPYGFFDAKEGMLRAPEILTDFRAAH